MADEELSGLQWLSRERPEAMQHLLAFFRESSRHLDPKTRFLISIVTKVVNLSERGLRQYIPRAIREGATPDEVLDAILCAYPAAGLTNVIDAVQVFRSLKLDGLNLDGLNLDGLNLDRPELDRPELDRPELDHLASDLAPSPQWQAVARVEDIPPGSATVVDTGDRSVAIYNVDGTFHATDNACLHQGAELGCGVLNGSTVTCPLHGWQFDVTTGACLTTPGQQVQSFPARIEGEEVQVLLH